MNARLVSVLVFCGTVCILGALGLFAYLIKQLTPIIASAHYIEDTHVLLVGIAAVPGITTFIVGIVLLRSGLRRAVLSTDVNHQK